jgi:hypothetical protein
VPAESSGLVAFGILCGCASLAASGGSATRTPLRLRFARLLGLGFAVCSGVVAGFGGWLTPWAVGWWEDARVKLSGSAWFGYGVVVLVTFVVGFLGFAVWVLAKVF